MIHESLISLCKLWNCDMSRRGEYLNDLSNLWDKIDHYRPLPPNSTTGVYILLERNYRFLKGLRLKFEPMREQLSNQESKLPSSTL